jgi:hypothetical protein
VNFLFSLNIFSTSGEAPLETGIRVSVEGSFFEEYSQYGEFRYSVESQGKKFSGSSDILWSHKVRHFHNTGSSDILWSHKVRHFQGVQIF